MVYTDKDFKRMEFDPHFQLQYYWRCGMNAKKMAGDFRRAAKKASMAESAGLIKQAETFERFHASIMEYVSRPIATPSPNTPPQ